MADIKSFKGILYNTKKIKDLSKVVVPPYDVISKKEQELFYRKSPYNIIRILLGKDFRNDTDKNNKYTRANRYFKEWISKGIFIQDEFPSIYIYLQEFLYKKIRRQRLGFIALMKLEDFGLRNIYPHEATMDGPKQDRFRLLKSVRANLSPIFMLYSDKDKMINTILEKYTSHQPIIDICDKDSVRHKLWSLKNPVQIDRIKKIMQGKDIFIADGHHRYEVALEVSKRRRDGRFGFIMSYFTDLEGDGLIILPVYRIIHGIPQHEALEFLKKQIQGRFLLNRFKSAQSLMGFLKPDRDLCRFGVYLGRLGFWEISPVKNFGKNELDVNILHKFIIDPMVERFSQIDNISIDFTKDVDSAVRAVKGSSDTIAFFLTPTKISQVRDIAKLGRRLPKKATYFYPKPLSGLVINRF